MEEHNQKPDNQQIKLPPQILSESIPVDNQNQTQVHETNKVSSNSSIKSNKYLTWLMLIIAIILQAVMWKIVINLNHNTDTTQGSTSFSEVCKSGAKYPSITFSIGVLSVAFIIGWYLLAKRSSVNIKPRIFWDIAIIFSVLALLSVLFVKSPCMH